MVADSLFHLRLNAEGEAADVEAFDLSAGAAQDGIVVARVDVGERAMNLVVCGEKRSSEAQASLAV